MPNFHQVLRDTIVRLARREARAGLRPLRREIHALRRRISGLPKAVTALGRIVAGLQRERDARRATLQTSEEEVRAARLSPRLVRKLRTRLKLTQGELARLTGVSMTAARAWEAGRSRPQGARRAALVALRRLGRREVARLLAAKVDGGAAGRRRTPRRRRGGRRRRTRRAK